MENRKMQTEYEFPCREAKPVWLPDDSEPNRYAQFLQKFTWDGEGPLSLPLSCDSRARVCLNGERIGFAFYDGTDDTSWYETFDLSAAAVRGENTLEIEVWYQGVSSNCYTAGRAYVIFAVMRGEGACAAASGAQTLCRVDTAYRAGEVPTNQIGMLWYYDQTAEPRRYAPAAELPSDGRRYAPRPIARQALSGRKRAAVCAHGYLLPGDREPFESAFLSARGKNVQLDAGADRYEIWDCGEESSGLLEIEVSSAAGCRVELGWGEHLDDLRVRSHIGSRMFQTAVTFGAGTHCFRHDFQRIGMRYLEVHLHPLNGGTAQCLYAGVRPLDYPVTERGEFYCSDRLHMQIYRTAVHTLRLCMHEHYEDCPWREQALYAMDSLNQAVCGYYCFGEYAFAAASLRMLARGMQADGFLELHTPGKEVVTIPYFTFMWVLGVRDYLRYSGDRELVRALWPSIRLAAQCRLRECRDGLLPVPVETKYWSFYEWNDLLSGEPIYRSEPLAPRIDAPYQMFFLLFLDAAAELAEELGERGDAAMLHSGCAEARRACHAMFWDAESGSYRTFAHETDGAFHAEDGAQSELVQALAVLSGTAGQAERERLLPVLAAGKNDWVPCTLSMIWFKYEALLTRQEDYFDWVFADIARIWGRMLYAGATSFWETEDGADAFDQAGSLCHGWSAMPVYFYYAYGLGVRPVKPGFARTADAARRMDGCYGSVPTPEGMIHVEKKAK